MNGSRYCCIPKAELDAAIDLLKTRWPLAFPAQSEAIRPLMYKLDVEIAKETGWSRRYAKSLLVTWMRQKAYKHAIPRCDFLHDLNGLPTEQSINAISRSNAGEWFTRAP